jgi:putative oxidoreductase
MKDLGLLVLRGTAGGLLAGHGAQKLFGAFGGNGLKGTAGWLESLGFRPGQPWALLAGTGEFGGGLLTALGLFHPLGPIMLLGPMSIATGKVHWGKPIWATEGGAELPVTNMAIGVALALIGPGSHSLDRLLGIRVPTAFVPIALLAVAGGTTFGLLQQPAPAAESSPPEEAGAELQADERTGAA